MTRRSEHYHINEYSRNLPDKTFLAYEPAFGYRVSLQTDDGRVRSLRIVKQDDVLCWVEPAKTFGFVARRTRWWSRGV